MSEQNEHYYESVFQTVGFVLIVADTSGIIQHWNRQAAKVLGSRPEHMIGTPLLNIFPAELRAEVAQALAGAQQGLPSDIEFKHTGPDGEKRTLAAIISPVLADAGQIVGVAIAMRDITARKKLSQQLAGSRRMAALGNMANGVAHHFNNILGGMLTSIDAALQSDNPRLTRKTLEKVAESVGRATRITNQLLAFSKTEHGLGEWIDLNAAVDGFLARLRSQLDRAGIRLETHVRRVPAVNFESHRIIPVLESIAQNSIDAMAGGGKLVFSMGPTDSEAVIRIEDTGGGIPPEQMEHLFEPFFTTKGTLGGGESDNVGLGLAAVHGLVSDMGGHIELTSQVGVGTQVQISLPLVRSGDTPLDAK